MSLACTDRQWVDDAGNSGRGAKQATSENVAPEGASTKVSPGEAWVRCARSSNRLAVVHVDATDIRARSPSRWWVEQEYNATNAYGYRVYTIKPHVILLLSAPTRSGGRSLARLLPGKTAKSAALVCHTSRPCLPLASHSSSRWRLIRSLAAARRRLLLLTRPSSFALCFSFCSFSRNNSLQLYHHTPVAALPSAAGRRTSTRSCLHLPPRHRPPWRLTCRSTT